MPRVIYRSIVLTLEIIPSGVDPHMAARATAAITGAWLQMLGERMAADSITPAYQITMRQLTPEQGAQLQILLCWFVLQAQRQEISDVE